MASPVGPLPEAEVHARHSLLRLLRLLGMVAGVSLFLPGFDDGRAFILVIAAPLCFGLAGVAIVTKLRVQSRSTAAVHSTSASAVGGPALVIPYSLALGVIY